MTPEWAQVIVAFVIGAGGVGLWQAVIVRTRLDSKERRQTQEGWQAINTAMLEDRAILQQDRINDRALLQREIDSLKVEIREIRRESGETIDKMRKEQGATITALREDLHEALEQISAQASKIEALDYRIKKLIKQIIGLGAKPDTGPLGDCE